MRNHAFSIDCPFFSKHRERIEEVAQFINSHILSPEKVNKAHDIIGIANILLNCPRYDAESNECENCRFILNIWKENARLIINAGGVAY